MPSKTIRRPKRPLDPAEAARIAAEAQEELERKAMIKRNKRMRALPTYTGISAITKLEARRDLAVMAAHMEEGVQEQEEEPDNARVVLRTAERPAIPEHSTQQAKRARAARWAAGSAEEMSSEMEIWEQTVFDASSAIDAAEKEAELLRRSHVCLREHLVVQCVALQEESEHCDDTMISLLQQIETEISTDEKGASSAGAARSKANVCRDVMARAFPVLAQRAELIKDDTQQYHQKRSNAFAANAAAVVEAHSPSPQHSNARIPAAAAAATPYGDGKITGTTADGATVVQLPYGTAYLQPSAVVNLSASATSSLPVLPTCSDSVPYLKDADMLLRWNIAESDPRVLKELGAIAAATARVRRTSAGGASGGDSASSGYKELLQVLPPPRAASLLTLTANPAADVNWPLSACGVHSYAATATARERALPIVNVHGAVCTYEWLGGEQLQDDLPAPILPAKRRAADALGGSSSSYREQQQQQRYYSDDESLGGSSGRGSGQEERAVQKQRGTSLHAVKDAAESQHKARRALSALVKQTQSAVNEASSTQSQLTALRNIKKPTAEDKKKAAADESSTSAGTSKGKRKLSATTTTKKDAATSKKDTTAISKKDTSTAKKDAITTKKAAATGRRRSS